MSDPGYERASLRVVLPWENGASCLFYDPLNWATMRLRTPPPFRPRGTVEHFPRAQLAQYQARNGGRGYGAGRPLDLRLVCYAPAGSGAAQEGVELLEELLEEMRAWEERSEWSRNAIGARYRNRYETSIRMEAESPGYRSSYRPPPASSSRGG